MTVGIGLAALRNVQPIIQMIQLGHYLSLPSWFLILATQLVLIGLNFGQKLFALTVEANMTILCQLVIL